MNNVTNIKKFIGLTGVGILTMMAFIAILSSTSTVDQSERGLIFFNGKLVRVVDPGLTFKTPFVETIKRMSMQQQTASMSDVQTYTKDQQKVLAHISVTFRLPHDPKELVDFYETFNNEENFITKVLHRNITSQLQSAFGRYTASEIVRNREVFNTTFEQLLRERLVNVPVEIVSIQVENIKFSREFEERIENRMRAEIEIETRKQNLETEKLNAEIARTKADGEADALLSKRKAEAEAIKLMGEAEAEAIKAKTEALAKSQEIVGYITAEKWDGKLPETMIPNGSVPFLDVNKLK